MKQPITTFHGLGIAPGILVILERLQFAKPTPIQSQTIPVAIEGKDVVGVAQTGTGKTLAFAIPMVQRLANSRLQGLVLLPTRELALQVDEEFNKVGRSLGLRTSVLIGGLPMYTQVRAIRQNPHIIIATPGRLIDHLQQKNIRFDNINTLVLDEADRMLDMGFLPQIRRILQAIPKDRQTMLFSATLPREVMHIASSYMKLPVRIEIAPSGTTVDETTQEIFIVARNAKLRLLEKILSERKGSVLVFTRTKHGARHVNIAVRAMGHTSSEIHANRSLNQRKDALAGFKSGKYRVLIATDIAARGIDVRAIELVINYDLPAQSEDYVHRIGRTGRAGAKGHAISFALPEEQRGIRNIERLIRKNLRISKLPELPPERHVPRPSFAHSNPRPRTHGRRPSRGSFRERSRYNPRHR